MAAAVRAIVQCLERIGFILSEFPAISRKENKYHKHNRQEIKLEQASQGKFRNPLVNILAQGEVINPKVSKSSSVSESIKMTIREKNIGAIFGKEGNKISDIRTKSGANISVSKYEETQKYRAVVITGSHHSVTVAQALINICLDQQQALEGHRSQQSDHTEQGINLSQSDVTATVTMLTKHA